MGCRIRLIEPHSVYHVTTRCNDRAFLFKPNHHPNHPLLADGCPPESLSSNNRIIPAPSVINIVGSALARAQQQRPVDLYCAEYSSNHSHQIVSPPPDKLDNLIEFEQIANSLIARGINKLWDREGHVFGGPYRLEPIIDDRAMEEKFLYALLNPVKDHLIEKPQDTPFFSTLEHHTQGKKLEYWYLDYAGFWAAGGKKHLKEFLKWVELKITPLPAWQGLTEPQRQTRARKLIKGETYEIQQEREENNRQVLGVQAIYEVDPRDRPKNPKPSGSQPLCHTSDPELKRAFREKWLEVRQAHKIASAAYREGNHTVDFPDGTCRPPIKKIYDSSKR